VTDETGFGLGRKLLFDVKNPKRTGHRFGEDSFLTRTDATDAMCQMLASGSIEIGRGIGRPSNGSTSECRRQGPEGEPNPRKKRVPLTGNGHRNNGLTGGARPRGRALDETPSLRRRTSLGGVAEGNAEEDGPARAPRTLRSASPSRDCSRAVL